MNWLLRVHWSLLAQFWQCSFLSRHASRTGSSAGEGVVVVVDVVVGWAGLRKVFEVGCW